MYMQSILKTCLYSEVAWIMNELYMKTSIEFSGFCTSFTVKEEKPTKVGSGNDTSKNNNKIPMKYNHLNSKHFNNNWMGHCNENNDLHDIFHLFKIKMQYKIEISITGAWWGLFKILTQMQSIAIINYGNKTKKKKKPLKNECRNTDTYMDTTNVNHN